VRHVPFTSEEARITMSIRYRLAMLALGAAGAFTVVSTYAFSRGSANAIDFAVAIGVTVVSLGAIAAGRSGRQIAVALATTAIGAWTILVTAGIFAGATQRWVTFAAACAVTGIALLETVAHDLREARAEAGAPATVTPLAQAA
jgi:hypothetical protein